jgi:hypothetical protein
MRIFFFLGSIKVKKKFKEKKFKEKEFKNKN